MLGVDTPAASGALIVDKPRGITSHDVVAIVRRALGTSRVGHTGTLDPLATGVLVLLVGQATRLSQFLVLDEKEYLADIRLGASTPTYDAESLDNSQPPTPNSQGAAAQSAGGMGEVDVDAALSRFRGTFLQTPPPFSAKKVAGRRAYDRARREQPVVLEPVQVTVSELERIASPEPSLVRLRLVVGSGFYVRSLAHDLGQRLGCGAHLEALRRTRVGRFTLAEAVSLERVQGGGPMPLVDMSRLLEGLPAAVLSESGVRRVLHGNAIGPELLTGSAPPAGRVRLTGPGGTLLAVGERRADGLLHPQIVLVPAAGPDVKY